MDRHADLDRKNLNIDFAAMTGDEDLSEHRTTFARQDIDALLKVTDVCLLPGWRNSTGAMNEARIATMLGLNLFEVRGALSDLAPVIIDAPFSAVKAPTPKYVNARAEVLLGAEALVNGDRNVQYGDPRADFQRTADFWNSYLGNDPNKAIEPHDVAAMMALLKLSRIAWTPGKADSWMDLAGYAACGWDCASAN